ncbi:DsbA family oxidoreductase [Paenibacillus lemnae]|uniref:DsbA family oxidoreductase n=1 Tax=Paenibacillus lemnae TaxID=1330551 RepID=A0A848MCK0_PAELE|nr:DsbA family oxidoreductase [Paenibacillus lemnae]NMO97793.1 DsbA family oxidoreductase [Paenibacillus lemnae]
MKVEIWSDFMCPFCYIGKRHFEEALERFPHKDQVEVIYRSFELSPDANYEPGVSMTELLAKKYGMTIQQAEEANGNVTEQAARAGLTYHLDRVVPANTFHAHRLVHFAAQHGKMQEITETLFHAYFTDVKDLGDVELLADLAQEAGLSREEAAAVLAGNQYADHVRADEEAAHKIGVRGVPFFVFGGKYAVSGAQPAEVFSSALDKALESEASLIMVDEKNNKEGGSCRDDSCGI